MHPATARRQVSQTSYVIPTHPTKCACTLASERKHRQFLLPWWKAQTLKKTKVLIVVYRYNTFHQHVIPRLFSIQQCSAVRQQMCWCQVLTVKQKWMWKRANCHLSHGSDLASDSRRITSFKHAWGCAKGSQCFVSMCHVKTIKILFH